MTDADLYFDAEVGALRQIRAERLAESHREMALQAAQSERRDRRRRHMVSADCSCDDGEICLLDVDADRLLAALNEQGGGADTEIAAVMRQARGLYLVGRKVEAMDALYPAIRDVLGVAI